MPAHSPHVASLIGAEPAFESDLGSVTQLTADTVPILQRLSIKRIVLEPGAIREPQWNVNANQLAYVVSGTVLVSMLGNADAFSLVRRRRGADVPRRVGRGVSHREHRRRDGRGHRQAAQRPPAALLAAGAASAR